MVAIDCGAHIGEYTLLFADLVSPDGYVHAFEPDPRLFAYLEENVATNRLANVVLNSSALGADEGSAAYRLADDPTMSGLSEFVPAERMPTDQTVKVQTTTLDSYAEAQGFERADALKIDVEGAEAAVLMGGSRLLAELHPGLVFVECDVIDTAQTVVEVLVACGYDVEISDRGHLAPHVFAHLPNAPNRPVIAS